MAFVVLGANSASGGYTVKNSLRFERTTTDYLYRTPASTTNRKTFTISTWVKRSQISANFHSIFSNNNNGFGIQFRSDDTIAFAIGTVTDAYVYTNRLFRDTSAWYHFVFVVDTTQATASDRIKMYVNGVQETSFSTTVYPAINVDTNINTVSIQNQIGNNLAYASYLSGYISEFYLIDGTALTPSSFGESDFDTGIWKPKAYTGTYGTNGFYLQFKNSASLGTDSSGNGNTFTVNNLTSVDQSTDTPTNNFATGNPLIGSNSGTLTEGNLTIANSTAAWKFFLSTQAVNKGKWYAEFRLSQITSYCHVGIMSTEDWEKQVTGYPYFGDTANSWSYNSTNGVRNNNTTIDNESTYTTNDIISIGLDCDNSKVYFAKNGTWINAANPVTNTNGYSITASTNYYLGNMVYQATLDANFGSPMHSANSYTDGAGYGNFSYAVPSGYYSLCTANLAKFG